MGKRAALRQSTTQNSALLLKQSAQFAQRDRRKQNEIACYQDMAMRSPVVLACLNTTATLISNMIGEYENTSYPEIGEHIKTTVQRLSAGQGATANALAGIACPTTLAALVKQTFMGTVLHGCYLAELAYGYSGDRVPRLARVQPWRVANVAFSYDKKQQLIAKAGEFELEVRPGHAYHSVGLADLDLGNPRGTSVLGAALDSDMLVKLAETAQSVALQHTAVPLLIGHTDLTAITCDEDGEELPPGKEMLEQLEAMRGGGVAVLHSGYDPEGKAVEDEIEALPQQIDYSGILAVMEHAEQNTALALSFPLALLKPNSRGGGDSNLVQTQRRIYLEYVRSLAHGFCSEIVEQVIRPEVEYTFGCLDDYGFIRLPTLQNLIGDESEQRIAALADLVNQETDDEIFEAAKAALLRVI